MEGKKYLIILLVSCLSFFVLQASNKSDVYYGFIGNNMPLWKKTIDNMNLQKDKTNEFILELLNYQYGFIAWCIMTEQDDLAETYMELGEKNIQILEKTGKYSSLVNSYRAAFYGFQINISIFQAPLVGSKSVDCAKAAMKQDPNNPYGYIQYGNSQFFMPSVFGGSKLEALENFKKAEILMEKDKEGLKHNWNYLSLLSMIARSYEELEDYNNAKICYEKILKIEPEFLWVKKELYPELLKKIK